MLGIKSEIISVYPAGTTVWLHTGPVSDGAAGTTVWLHTGPVSDGASAQA